MFGKYSVLLLFKYDLKIPSSSSSDILTFYFGKIAHLVIHSQILLILRGLRQRNTTMLWNNTLQMSEFHRAPVPQIHNNKLRWREATRTMSCKTWNTPEWHHRCECQYYTTVNKSSLLTGPGDRITGSILVLVVASFTISRIAICKMDL